MPQTDSRVEQLFRFYVVSNNADIAVAFITFWL